MRWSIALLFACACGRVGFDPVGENTDGDGGTTDAIDALSVCASWNAWSAPTRLPFINSSGIDWAPSISDDSLYMTFSSNRGGNHELFTTQRQSLADAWESPALIAELTNMFDEEDDATLSADLREMVFGKTMIFRTTRPDLASPWGQRQVIVPGDFDLVQGAELTRDDLRLYFSAGSPIEDLYLMERPNAGASFGPYVQIMPDPDPNGDSGYPTLSADELELFLSSEHNGERDIYSSRRASRTASFPPATIVDELSDPGTADWDPELSFDGTTMWLSSNRAGGQGLDIYVATRTCAD
jgi:Tol biopolymer transport system component